MPKVMANDRLLEFHHVSYSYTANRLAVVDVSFSLGAGECVAIMGANGSGKSTVARLAAGLIEPTAGSVLRRPAAYVAQEPHANMVGERVRDDVSFALKVHGMPPEETEARTDAALATVGMEWARDLPLSTLSGGEMQRVALAAAVASGARLWVLDEPTGHLPRAEARRFWSALAGVQRRLGIGILLITHRPEEARIANWLLCLAHGRVAAAGTPRRVMGRAAMLSRLGIRFDLALALWNHLYGDDRPLPEALDSAEERVVEALCSALNR